MYDHTPNLAYKLRISLCVCLCCGFLWIHASTKCQHVFDNCCVSHLKNILKLICSSMFYILCKWSQLQMGCINKSKGRKCGRKCIKAKRVLFSYFPREMLVFFFVHKIKQHSASFSFMLHQTVVGLYPKFHEDSSMFNSVQFSLYSTFNSGQCRKAPLREHIISAYKLKHFKCIPYVWARCDGRKENGDLKSVNYLMNLAWWWQGCNQKSTCRL